MKLKDSSSIGILLTNLGTPDAPTPEAVQKYLAEFLTDPQVVKLPRWLWMPILYGIILKRRPQRSAHAYQKIWRKEGSPLLFHSKTLADKLQEYLQEKYPNIKIVLAMRYGSPSILEGLTTLQHAKVEKVLVLPLYPQFSHTTTSSTFDAVTTSLRRLKYSPQLHCINHYFDNIAYIDAIANHIKSSWQRQSRGDKLFFSFHGLPKKSIAQKDPYYFQCQTTAELIAKNLKLANYEWQVVFQSRFGWQEWLQPYCDIELQESPKLGYKNVDIVCPGFATDCLETLEEINIRYREVFLKAGGKQFNYIPALNDSAYHVQVLTKIIEENMVWSYH